ncbi:MAG: ABC transporter permease subunit [Gammaproteobacteria bacterium]
MRISPLSQGLIWFYVLAILGLLYWPLLPPILTSFSQTGLSPSYHDLTFKWYGEIGNNPLLVGSIKTSFLIAALVGVITPVLGLLAAMAVRELGIPRLVLMLLLLPLFIPGVSMGLANAFFFRQLGVTPSLWTITVVHVLWALPFASLIILTAMASFDPVYSEAAYVHGANRWRAFRDVELPLIRSGVGGAAMFAMILSFNETVRTTLVQGALNTVQTYIWSRYLQVGLSPAIYVLMSLMIVTTLVLVLILLIINLRRSARVAA